jgi:hypothetical protein
MYINMQIILVCLKNFQSYIIDNINNLLAFDNNDIHVITEVEFFNYFENLPITLVDCSKLDDFNYNLNSQLDRNFRNGFWYLCSLRFFYLYSYMKNNNLSDVIHLENDVLTYVNFNDFNFKNNKVYVTFDCETRVIPGIIYIPNYEAFKPIIENYNFNLNDMENLAIESNENYIEQFPIFPIVDTVINKYNKNFNEFNSIFDTAAIGQYLGGVDSRNISGDTRGFVNETCIIKYDVYKFVWIKTNSLYIPHIIINDNLIRINNLHIHSKDLYKFLAINPIEDKLITKL